VQSSSRTAPIPARRIGALKPGLRGARNWATAQIRAASYSRKKMVRMILAGVVLFLTCLWLALWLGGFLPGIKTKTDNFTKQRLMSMGFVVKHVDVVGEGRISEAQVLAVLGVKSGDYLFDMDIKSAQSRVQSLNWVDTAVVRRLWPNRVSVYINERSPYALWQKNGTLNLVDKSGDVISDVDLAMYATKPLIVGVGAEAQASTLFQQLAAHPKIAQQAEAYVLVGGRRWDIVLKDSGSRIMLPEKNVEQALSQLESYTRSHDLLSFNVQSIDLRVEGRISLRPRSTDRRRRA
jgi:cell division protein FtsQ